MAKPIKVNIIGSGNVATHFIREFLKHPEIELQQVYARNLSELKEFEGTTSLINDIHLLLPSDISIISISDDSIEEFSKNLRNYQSLVVHTSGSMPVDILHTPRKGVFYPFQSFTKAKKNINFRQLPIIIEAATIKDSELLMKLAKIISDNTYSLNSEQRLALHTAGVFAANFVNYMYIQAEEILNKNQIPFDIIKPLIIEVAQKASLISPKKAQTGPAKRKDKKTIEKHLKLLEGNTKLLYQLITESIFNDF